MFALSILLAAGPALAGDPAAIVEEASAPSVSLR